MKTMIVTGASSGIGYATALRAAKAGFATVLVARNASALDALATKIRAQGGACTALALDVREPSAAEAIISTAVGRYGRVDVVLNNAGVAASGALLEQSDAALQTQWETHVLAPLRLTRRALPELLKAGGQVFFFGSGVARIPTPGFGVYPAAKAAVRAVATQMRRELRGSGVAITYVDPGAVDTPLMERAGMQGPPRDLTISPYAVADKIIRATSTRPRAVNAAPWQTFAVALGELLPALTDTILATFPQLAGAAHPRTDTAVVLPEPVQTPIETAQEWHVGATPFEKALEPVSRRMERVKLPREFIERLLVPSKDLELGDVAMRWAGMPNKNERAALVEVFNALTAAEYLRQTGDETWTVLRSSDAS